MLPFPVMHALCLPRILLTLHSCQTIPILCVSIKPTNLHSTSWARRWGVFNRLFPAGCAIIDISSLICLRKSKKAGKGLRRTCSYDLGYARDRTTHVEWDVPFLKPSCHATQTTVSVRNTGVRLAILQQNIGFLLMAWKIKTN